MRILLREDPGERRPGLSSYLGAGVVCALTVVLTLPLLGRVDLANIVLLFVLAVAGIATRWGRDPARAVPFGQQASPEPPAGRAFPRPRPGPKVPRRSDHD